MVPSSATPFDDDPLAGLEDALAVQRIDADGLAAQKRCKGAAGNEIDVMPVGEHDQRIRMDFAGLQPRHPMVHAPRQFADFGVQRAAEGDVHLLQAAADAEQRDAARDAGLRQRQRQTVALQVVGLVPGVRLGAEMRRVNIGAGAGQHHAVDRIQQRADIGDFGQPANISGSAPATSATARRLRSPDICVANRSSMR